MDIHCFCTIAFVRLFKAYILISTHDAHIPISTHRVYIPISEPRQFGSGTNVYELLETYLISTFIT